MLYSFNIFKKLINNSITYFTQSTVSSIFSISVSFHVINPIIIKYSDTLIIISVLIKLGAAPSHTWFPQVREGLSFKSLAVALTIQKVACSPRETMFSTAASSFHTFQGALSSKVPTGSLSGHPSLIRQLTSFIPRPLSCCNCYFSMGTAVTLSFSPPM